MKGKLIILEGLDGAGIETQTKLLIKYLNDNGISSERIEYPDYDRAIGKLIQDYLYNKYDFDPDTQVMLYIADMVKDKTKIQKWLSEGKVVVSQRYATSTMAYQGLKGFSVEKIVKLAELFDLPKPDLIIYLKISAETSMIRKSEEKENGLDRHESDKKLLEDLYGSYKNLMENSVFGEWVELDGEKSIEEIAQEIREILVSRSLL